MVSNSSQLKENLQTLREQPDRLIEIILRQAGVIEEQQQKIQELEKQIQDLNDRNNGLSGRLEQLEKAAARQAAPFRIADKHRKASPGKPGRKPGHPGAHRSIPDHVDEEIVVPLTQCPDCGQAVQQSRAVVQYIEELPVLRPKVIKLITHQADCAHCQKEIRSTHPLQVSLAEGAASVQLGPAALGLAAELNKKHGLTMRKTCAVLRQLFGLGLSPGGLSAALERLARKLGPAYERLRARLRDGPYVHSDETSWWVGGPGHWLWVFARKDATVYRVAPGRGRNIVLETLGQDYAGVLVSDCLSVYDEVNARQQKCYSHHLKAVSKALDEAPSEYLQHLASPAQGRHGAKRHWAGGPAVCPAAAGSGAKSPRAVEPTPRWIGGEGSSASVQAAGSFVHLLGSPGRGGHEQFGRTATAAGRNRQKTLLR